MVTGEQTLYITNNNWEETLYVMTDGDIFLGYIEVIPDTVVIIRHEKSPMKNN